jgi:predicted nucleotidyltransferase
MLIRMVDYPSERLGIKVNLVMKKALKPRIGQRILEPSGSSLKKDF